ncbi:hypothetical protein LTR56_023570 [Elasticomyces elasticus]|nr:hypothetical protein LTR56_023570 [Elasticomyces elasticus]KAK3624238.1 hypothetical protein LTR22_024066 [Elasticomyces elasticus]KAK4906080.1 hypothetical protein LTR49_024708 [Elasticomyces elasticus]KAK5744116.1 hypothetical protein LTS12_023592 [Elasticomyces elasticus]
MTSPLSSSTTPTYATASGSSSQTLLAGATPSSLFASAAPTSQGGSKCGIIATPDAVVPPWAQYPKITWAMHWWEGSTTGTPNDWMFLPELTHLDPDQYWKSAIGDLKHSQSPYLAGFLEPGDNNYSVAEAVRSWDVNLETLSGNFTLIPPIVAQTGLDLARTVRAGVHWVLSWWPFCVHCVRFCDPGRCDGVQEAHEQLHGEELWVANLGPLGDDGSPEWLMRQLLLYLDGLDIVPHYAWAGDKTFLGGSSLMPLAELYCTL